jgi:RNA polymerase sigma-70 factor (ECF subfamily)
MPGMSLQSAESSVQLPFIEGEKARESSMPTPLEREVVRLFNEFRNPLLRYLLSFGLTTHDGEEVVQEVFLALFLHLRRGKSRTNLRGWIFRVGHNLALKHRMRQNRNVTQFAEARSADQYLDSGPDPEEQLTNSQRQLRLQSVVRCLPELDRCCLYLRAEGLRYREIAEALGMSLGGISLSLGRSLARLRLADRGECHE